MTCYSKCRTLLQVLAPKAVTTQHLARCTTIAGLSSDVVLSVVRMYALRYLLQYRMVQYRQLQPDGM
jgi:hypothetical protein